MREIGTIVDEMDGPLVGSTQGRDLYDVPAGGFHFRLTEYHGGTRLAPHRHEHAKMSTAVRGRYTESFAGNGIDCDARTLLVKPPDVCHADHYAPYTLCLTVDLSAEVLRMVSSFSTLFGKVRETPLRTPVIDRILNELQRPDALSSFALEGLAMELVVLVARRDFSASRTAAAFDRACDFLDAHQSATVRLSDVAEAAGVHPTQLSRIFRVHAGMSPTAWLRSRRVEEAKRRLRGSNDSIADIALSLGFYDQSHFTNVFRRTAGVTPAHYRRAGRR